MRYEFGLYEKALPRDLALPEKLKIAKELGYDYFELSTDESEAFQGRVRASEEERTQIRQAIREYGIPIRTMCLSGTRNCPLGSEDPALREKGLLLTKDAIRFAVDIGIRIVQIMAYDEYYGERSERTRRLFLDGLAEVTAEAASCGVMLALENVDIETMDDLEKGLDIIRHINSPWLQIYSDIANLYATGRGNEWACGQYRLAGGHIVASHVKDTVVGTVRDIPFGAGEVDFVAFFRTLAGIGFSGPLTLEMWAQNYEDPVKAAGESLVFVSEKLEKSMQRV